MSHSVPNSAGLSLTPFSSILQQQIPCQANNVGYIRVTPTIHPKTGEAGPEGFESYNQRCFQLIGKDLDSASEKIAVFSRLHFHFCYIPETKTSFIAVQNIKVKDPSQEKMISKSKQRFNQPFPKENYSSFISPTHELANYYSGYTGSLD